MTDRDTPTDAERATYWYDAFIEEAAKRTQAMRELAEARMQQNRAELLAEDIEAFHMAMDGLDAPREDKAGRFSMLGRVTQLLAEARRDQARYRELASRYVGADFQWGEPSMPVIVFKWDAPVSADLTKTIDAAIASEPTPPQS